MTWVLLEPVDSLYGQYGYEELYRPAWCGNHYPTVNKWELHPIYNHHVNKSTLGWCAT